MFAVYSFRSRALGNTCGRIVVSDFSSSHRTMIDQLHSPARYLIIVTHGFFPFFSGRASTEVIIIYYIVKYH